VDYLSEDEDGRFQLDGEDEFDWSERKHLQGASGSAALEVRGQSWMSRHVSHCSHKSPVEDTDSRFDLVHAGSYSTGGRV
jgi:hypothetical protein